MRNPPNGFSTLNPNKQKNGMLVYPTDNPPLPRPGIYRLRCTANGWNYIGGSKNVLKRAIEHANFSANVVGITEAMRRFGKSAFVFEPLYYTIAEHGTRQALGLHLAEQQLINAYDSIAHGWNQPMPDVVSRSKTPEAIEKRKRTEALPKTKAKRSEATLRRNADPEFFSRYLQTLHDKVHTNPTRNARISASRTGKVYGPHRKAYS